MAIKLHGSPLSPNVLRVLACLHEKGLDYEFLLVDMRSGAHKKEPFLSLNPFGQVPALEDGHLKLFDSRAITHYLANKYCDKGTPLLSSDPEKQAVITVWMQVESGTFDTHAMKLLMELILKPMFFGQATDQAAVAEHLGKLEKVLDVYEVRLAKSKYLGWETFSLADLHHIPVINALWSTEVKAAFESRAHVKAWCQVILARPAWKKVLEFVKK